MKKLGITTEYNPFHNGHKYIACKAKEAYGADCVIAVMSGDFTQRGEPAISDKWTRAKTAVTSSEDTIDIVFELPFAFACNRAEYFAKGAVDMLVKLGTDCIAFGCETDSPDELRQLASKLKFKKEKLAENTALHMKTGVSHAKAYETAVRDEIGNEATRLLSTPNNILAIEYLKRIADWREKGIEITDLPIKRVGSGYNDVSENYAGASKIREMILRDEDVSRFVPTKSVYEDYFLIEHRYFEMLKAIILRSSSEEMASIYNIGEGFENKLMKEIVSAKSLNQYLSKLVSKRYTTASVKRMLTYLLLGLKGRDMDTLVSIEPTFCRLLAAGKNGRAFIRNFDSDELSIVTNVNKIDSDSAGADYRHMLMDIHAADMYNLLCGRDIYSSSDRVMRPFIS